MLLLASGPIGLFALVAPCFSDLPYPGTARYP